MTTVTIDWREKYKDLEIKHKMLEESHDCLKNAYDNELTTIAYLRGFKDGVIAVCGEPE